MPSVSKGVQGLGVAASRMLPRFPGSCASESVPDIRMCSVNRRGFPDGTVVENLPAKQEMHIPSLGGEDPLK